MKILFYGDECREFWGLLPVMNILKDQHEITFGSIDPRAQALAKKYNFPVTTSFEHSSMLVVNKMHYHYARVVSETYHKQGKPVVLIEHGQDARVHLADTIYGLPINFFTVMTVSGPLDFNLLKDKFPRKLRMTGIPRFDKLLEAPKWDKEKIYKLVGEKKFLLVTIPMEDQCPPELERKYFVELPKLSPLKLIYKVHPRYNHERYLEYNQTILEDDTLTDDITYEIINASEGIITASSFMMVEASILRKPVIIYGYGEEIPAWGLIPELSVYRTIPPDFDPKKLSSTFDNLEFKDYQLEMIRDYLHDGKNSQRVAGVINELAASILKPKREKRLQEKKKKQKRKKKKK